MAFYTEFLIFPFSLTIIIYLLVRIVGYKNKTSKYLPIDFLFIVYIFMLISLLFFPLYINLRDKADLPLYINLVPFQDIIRSVPSLGALAYIVGNMLLFGPLALYNLLRFPHKLKRGFIIVLIGSISGELMQLLIMYITRTNNRIFDIDDLIFNVLGGIVAWVVTKKLLGLSKKKNKNITYEGVF